VIAAESPQPIRPRLRCSLTGVRSVILFFYIHVDGVLAPHVRVAPLPGREAITETVANLMDEWPSFRLIEVYDSADQPVARFAPEGARVLQ
jgi:hypothetical protein